jgi:hypothetical protein
LIDAAGIIVFLVMFDNASRYVVISKIAAR